VTFMPKRRLHRRPASAPDDDEKDAISITDSIGRGPALAGREAILASFRRSPPPAQPAPRQADPEPTKPWFAGSRGRPREDDALSDDGFRFILEGAGNLAWSARKHGPPPGPQGAIQGWLGLQHVPAGVKRDSQDARLKRV
jgi:hypothetical protein